MTREEAAERRAARLDGLCRRYAVKFDRDWTMDRHAARGVTAEPTDANLAMVLDGCARAPRPEEYPAIRRHVQVYRAEQRAARREEGR